MKHKCPNKSYKSTTTQSKSDWEILVDGVGESNAMSAFLQNNETLPTIEEINGIIMSYKVFQDKVSTEEAKIIKELSHVNAEDIVTIVDEIALSAKNTLNKLTYKKNYQEQNKIFTTKDGINFVASLESLLKDANQASIEKSPEEALNQKIRSVAIYIVETNKLVDLMKQNVNNIVEDKDNAYKNIPTLQYYLYTLNDWKFILQDTKKMFSGLPNTIKKINEVLKKIEDIDAKVIENDISGMVSAFKPYLAPISPKYLAPIEERMAKLRLFLNRSTPTAEQKKAYQSELTALEKKIKDFDFSTDENIIALLKGERGDASFVNSLLEAYSDNTNPLIASFAQWLKDNINDVFTESNAIEIEYNKELEEIVEKLGGRFDPESVNKELLEESERVDRNGEVYTVLEIANKWNGVEEVEIEDETVSGGYKKIDQLFLNKRQNYRDLIKNGVDVEENKKLLSALNKQYTIWKKDNLVQPYTEEYYEKYELWEDEVGQELKQEIDEIWRKINNIQSPLLFGEELTDEQYEEIDALFDEYIALGSFYSNGVKKTEKRQIEKVEKMREIRKLNSKIFQYTENNQAFEKAKQRHSEKIIAKNILEGTEEYNKEMESWIEDNTRDVISDEYWKLQKAKIEELAELTESSNRDKEVEGLGSISSNYKTILDATYGHRDEDNQPIGTEIVNEASSDIKKAMENIEQLKNSIANASGLSKKEYELLSELQERNAIVGDLTMQELALMDKLQSKLKSNTGGSERQKALDKIKKERIKELYKELRELSSRIPTKYYIATFNTFSQKLGVSIDSQGNFKDKPILKSHTELKKLFKDAEFKKWFTDNHIETEVWNSELKEFEKAWVRTFQWSRVVPTDEEFVQRKPARKYSVRSVKNEYLTGYNPLTDKVELKEWVHIDNKGRFLPKPGRFVSEKYENLPADIKKLLKIHTKYHLLAQEDIPNQNKLVFELPRVLKTASERNLKFLEKFKEKPTDVPKLIWEAIKAKWQNITNFSQGEGNYEYVQEVFADKYGNEFTSVPIKYKDKMELKDVSLDVSRSIMKYTFSAKMNKRLIELNPYTKALNRIVQDPEHTPLDLAKSAIGLGTPPKGSTNVTQQAIFNLTKRILEGKEKKEELGKGIEKAASILKKLTVLKTIAFDVPGGVLNVVDMERENMVNAAGGAYTLKNLANAHRVFFAEYFPAFLKEYKNNKLGEKSLQTQMFETFNFTQGRETENELGEKFSSSKIKDTIGLNFILNHRQWGEVFGQSINALAYLDAIKVEQTQPDGLVKMIPLRDAYELDSKGIIKLKDGIDEEWAVNGRNTLDTIEKIRFASTRMNGNYENWIDRPEAETYTWYSTVFMMKKFFIPKAVNRFAGSKVKLTKYGIRVDPRYNLTQGSEIGYIADMFNLVADELETKLQTGEWHTMTEKQKQNLYKSLMDAGLILFFYFFLTLGLGWDDDDEKRWEKLKNASWAESQGLYLSARALTEATTFYNPYQYKDFIFGSPIIAKTITDYLDLLRLAYGNMVNDEDSYYKKDYGLYKEGESKAKVQLYKILGAEKVIKGVSNDAQQQAKDYLKLRER